MKQFENLDVRLGVGVGTINYKSEKVTTSNGLAFIRSGESFEALKKQNIILSSGNEGLDKAINTMLGLALYIADRWTPTVSKIIKMAIEHPDLKQQELADQLDKSQSNISEALKRGGFDEIMMMNTYYKSQISKL
jgi:glutamate/tyrosine decarboxylase-like PLP-dependent enzyme